MPTHALTSLLNGIGDTLKTNAELAGYVGGRIYHMQAPPGTPLDCVEYEITAGGSTNDNPRNGLDVTVEVRGISTSEARAQTIFAAFSRTFQETGPIIPGWDVSRHVEGNWYVHKFWQEGQEYWAVGAFFDIYAVKRG